MMWVLPAILTLYLLLWAFALGWILFGQEE
jgi:hypothetical protein